MENELELLAQHGPRWIHSHATMACAVLEQYASGGLEQEELQDIVVRMCDALDTVAEARQDLDTKSQFITLLYSEAGII